MASTVSNGNDRSAKMASTVSNGNDRSEKWHRPFQMATTVYEREIRVGETTSMYANRLVCESTCMRNDRHPKTPVDQEILKVMSTQIGLQTILSWHSMTTRNNQQRQKLTLACLLEGNLDDNTRYD